MKFISLVYMPVIFLLFTSCNKDKEIIENVKYIPVIELDSETGIYTVKIGRQLTIAPSYQHADDAVFTWTIEGKIISSEPVFTYTWAQSNDVVYIDLRVENPHGYASEELKVEVLELAPPVISLAIPSRGLEVLRHTDYIFAPDIQNDDLDGFKIEWLRNDQVVGTEQTYTFNEAELGTYPLEIRASNVDGATSRTIEIEVVETMPYDVKFPAASYFQASTDRYTFANRPVCLRPLLEYFDYPQFEWSVNGSVIPDAVGSTYSFIPAKAGEYMVSLTVSEEIAAQTDINISRNIMRGKSVVTASVTVVCVEASESDRYRAATGSSSRSSNKVYEYTAAPGQFINETLLGGMTGNETSTLEKANAWAQQRLHEKDFVSLGGFGGYIIVGFDHSIVKSNNEYDFTIQANAFEESSEPGIVWVMQDVNGNGLPDDEWYELKGSETGKEGTIQDYAVTYFRPAGQKMNVQWTDSEGNNGYINHMGISHNQDSYYPAWIKEDSYTLTGTCLAPRNAENLSTGKWINKPYDWGYADNFGSDRMAGDNTADGTGQRNGFKISNAVYSDGSSVELQYIDFIKVQAGVNAKSGPLGEISTEVCSFEDLSLSSE